MSVLQGKCPSCAAQIEFKSGASIVVICPFCRSAVARTDRALEDLGKVAEIAQSQSPLKIGLKGTWRDNRFELTGRAQNRHELGGFWDEWYATFSNGWVGWLAEAQGKFYLTFYQPSKDALPSFAQLQLGQTVEQIQSNSPLMVTEKGTATSVAAEGEIPYRLTPNEKSDYADLAGANRAFATIDYGMNPPWVFVGEEATLKDLGLADARPAERAAPKVSTASMGCPNCGGPLSLQIPESERVTCPNCDSLLDVNQGRLTWLKSLLPKPDAPPFDLQIGQKGTFSDGVEQTIIGAMVRSVTVDGIKYFWHEYLLYNLQLGYRWLVHSDNHWNFVEPINAADVVENGNTATYDGKVFKIFQNEGAVVEYVKGEFYWRVSQGEAVRAVDYVNAPLMLSMERGKNELNWSKGTYLTRDEVEKAFNISDLPKPWSVAPNQPYTGGFYIKWGFAVLGLFILFAIIMIPLGGFSNTPLNQSVTLPPTASVTTAQTVFSQPFELKSNRNVRITASAPVNNSYAELDVDLINEQNSEVESVNIPIEYYSGADSDGSWTEGGQTQDATLSSLPAGKYTLRVEGTWQNFQQPLPISLKVEQNVSRGCNFIFAFVLLCIVPFVSLIRKWTFESRRWSESSFGGGASGGESDDE